MQVVSERSVDIGRNLWFFLVHWTGSNEFYIHFLRFFCLSLSPTAGHLIPSTFHSGFLSWCFKIWILTMYSTALFTEANIWLLAKTMKTPSNGELPSSRTKIVDTYLIPFLTSASGKWRQELFLVRSKGG